MFIATTKTTVLGIRLDHDRRTWVEDAAAREGVTVRAYFEGLIDQARRDEEAAFAASVHEGLPPPIMPSAAETREWGPGGEPLGGSAFESPLPLPPPPPLDAPGPALVHVVALSGQMACGVLRLTSACLRTAGRGVLAPWQVALRSARR